MKKYFLFPSIFFIIISTGCLTFNYEHRMEKFIEHSNMDFNHVKTISIICDNSHFSDVLKDFFFLTYRNRGLAIPKIRSVEKIRDGFETELYVVVKKVDYKITNGWDELNVEKDNGILWKKINLNYEIDLTKASNFNKYLDMTNDSSYIEKLEIKNLGRKFKNKKFTDEDIFNLSKKEMKEFDDYYMISKVVNIDLKNQISKRLIPISKEVVTFKIGLNKDLLEAYRLLKLDKIDEAALIWEEVYSNDDLSNYARSIAAYNIGVYNAMNNDFEGAEKFFDRSDNLDTNILEDLFNFQFSKEKP